MAAILATAATLNEFTRPVILRIVGDTWITADQVAGADSQETVMGIRVQSEAGQLNPLTNADANWMYFWTHYWRLPVLGTGENAERRHFDIRVARKVPRDGLLTAVFENSAGGTTVRVAIAARVLVAEGRSS